MENNSSDLTERLQPKAFYQTHPLAEAESHILRAKTLITLVQREQDSLVYSLLPTKYVFGSGTTDLEGKSIDAIAGGIESLRNYQMNPLGPDGFYQLYNIIRPVIHKVTSDLGAYRSQSEIHTLFTDVMDYAEQQGFSCYIKGSATAGLVELFMRDSDLLLEYAGAKGGKQLKEVICLADKDTLSSTMRGWSESLRNNEGKKIDYAITHLETATDSVVDSQYDRSLSHLGNARLQIKTLRDERMHLQNDMKMMLSWFCDVGASVIENLEETEYHSFRNMLQEQISDRI